MSTSPFTSHLILSATSSASFGTTIDKYANDMLIVYNKKKVDSDDQRKLFIDSNKIKIINFITKFIEKNPNMNFTIIVRFNMIVCISSDTYKQYKRWCDFTTCQILGRNPCIITDKDGNSFSLLKDEDYLHYGFSGDCHSGNGYIVHDVIKMINEYSKSMKMHQIQTEIYKYGTVMNFQNKKQLFLNTFGDPILHLVNECVKWKCINTNNSQFGANIMIIHEGIIFITDKLLTKYNFEDKKIIDFVIAGDIPEISSYDSSPTTSTNVLIYRDYIDKNIKLDNVRTYDQSIFDNNVNYTLELIESYFSKTGIEYKLSYSKNYTLIQFSKSF